MIHLIRAELVHWGKIKTYYFTGRWVIRIKATML